MPTPAVTFANIYNAQNACTYSVTGTGDITASLTGSTDGSTDSHLWLLVDISGTLSYTVTASSEPVWDGGRLYLTSSAPAAHGVNGGVDVATIAGLTNVSEPVSGVGTSTGTVAVTAGQYLVLRYRKDSEDSANDNKITAAISITPTAVAQTLYYNGAVDTDWNEIGNWWTSDTFATQASALPTSIDNVVLSATCDTNNGSAPTVVNLTYTSGYLGTGVTITGTATFNDGAYNDIGLTGNPTYNGGSFNNASVTGNPTYNTGSYNSAGVTGNPTFNGSSYNDFTVTGDATFNGTSVNYNTVSNNATFNDSSFNDTFGVVSNDATFNGSTFNNGTVTNDATFNDGGSQGGTVSGNATFNDTSVNQNTVSGNATFNDSSYNADNGGYGIVAGNATFNDSSYNNGTVSGNATWSAATFTNFSRGTVSGTITFSSATAVVFTTDMGNGWTYDSSSWTFTTADPTWIFDGGGTNNTGTLDGDATFDAGSHNSGTVSNDATFNDTSFNNTGGTVGNLATFNGTSYNSSTVNSAIFNNTSYNSYAGSGVVTTDATFNDSSYNGGTVSGNAIWSAAAFTTFSLGTVSGTITFSNASPVVFTTDTGNIWTYDSSSWNFTAAGPTWVFNDTSTYNSGTLNGDATFNDVSNNTGTVSGNATFNDNAYNNGGTITGNATFNDSSNNQTGTVSGNGTFNDTSHNDATVSTNATFNGSSSNQGVVTGTTTFNDNSGCTYAAVFNGNITVNYPVPVPLNSNGSFGTMNSLGVGVGITYVGYSTPYLSWNAATNAPVDTWTHIAFVRINGICRLYADGVTVLNFSNNVDLGASHIVTIGTGAHNLAENFPGYIDEVRISSSGIYNGDFSPPTSPLTDDSSLLLLHFDGNMTDSSSHSLTVGGTATTTASESKFGGSSINTSSSYAQIGNNALFGFGTGDFTIEMWIYPTSVSAVGGLINIGTYDNGILIRHGSNSDTLYMSGSRTLYFNNGYGQNGEWNDQKNWFFDTNYSYLPSFIPTSADNVITNNNIATNGAGEPTIKNFSATSCTELQINLTVTGMATFTCSSPNVAITVGTTLTGNATFNGYASPAGTVTGSGIFNGTTHNDGTVGYGVFNDTSSNGLNAAGGGGYIGYVTNNAVFNDSSTNGGGQGGSKGIVSGNAIFNDSSVNNCYYDLNDVGATPETGDGFVHGSATFRGQSKNQKGVGGSVILAYDKGINGSNILGIF